LINHATTLNPKGHPMQNSKRTLLRAASAALLGAVTVTRAHGDKDHPKTAGPAKQKDWGIAGDAKSAKRLIEVRMLDSMRFTPDRIDLRVNETVRFTVVNTGKVMHEFVIGTKKENEAHAALMMKFPDMEHDEPYLAHVPAGKRGEIVWAFNRAGEFEFACLIAGHYQAGMVGKIIVSAN
jgi:uncharacterized cupredoxin-like copper-binding protein